MCGSLKLLSYLYIRMCVYALTIVVLFMGVRSDRV